MSRRKVLIVTSAAVSTALLGVTVVNIAFPTSSGRSHTIRSATCPGSSTATTSCFAAAWVPGRVRGRARAWG